MSSLKDALDMLNVSMEQGNALYRNIVKKMFDDRLGGHGTRLGEGRPEPSGRVAPTRSGDAEGTDAAHRDGTGMRAWSSAGRARTRSSPSS